MRSLRPPLRLYVAGVIGAGAAALGVGALAARPAAADLAAAAMLFAIATATQLRPIHLTQKTKVTVEDGATFAAVLLLDPLLAMLVAGASRGAAGLRAKASWYNRAFNVAAATLDTAGAAFAYAALAGGARPSGTVLAAIIAAAGVKFAINSTVVDVAVSLQLRRRLFDKWWARHQRDTLQLLSLYVFGGLAAIAAASSAMALALLLVPSALALVILRNAARIEARTKAAIHGLAKHIEERDHYTYGHSQRVADLAERLARRMKLEQVQIDLIREAALLHDIGKIGTPDRVLLKPAALDPDERREMNKHAELGFELLEVLPAFWEGAELVRAHHERVDGTGYPRGLRGYEVPIEVSVIAVCDAYDAMTRDRVYRKALPWDTVRRELEGGRGRQWHAEAVDAFLELVAAERDAAGLADEVA